MLTPEWRSRILRFRDELKNHFYRKLGALDFEGFTSFEALSPGQARRGCFVPMPVGTHWGAKWEYAWFRGAFTAPRLAPDERLKLSLHPGGELLVWIDGKLTGGGIRAEDRFFIEAQPGARVEVLLEAYAGHGPHVRIAGPTPPGRITVPEPPPAQVEVEESSWGAWQETVWQLWLDVETLMQLRDSIDPDSLRVAEIDEGLRAFSTLWDPEHSHETLLQTAKAARRRLAPLLACRNGSTAPTFFAVGHGHLDVAYMWPLAQSERKAAATFANQLELMKEYPAHTFMQSQPHLYTMVKRLHPELYEALKPLVKEGRFIADGAMWVEADTNLSGGESLIRQLMQGLKFFRDEFGQRNEVLWLPDVFGYSGALPQLMKGCGIKYFATAKLFWTYNGAEAWPHNVFTWEGIDGSKVLAHVYNEYGSPGTPRDLVVRWNERPQKDRVATRLYAFGHSDGGGGPTREQLEFLRRAEDLEGLPRVKASTPLAFFQDLEQRPETGAHYVGELYYPCHRGTYTTQARTKRGNRRAEFALREGEWWGSVAGAVAGHAFPREAMADAWTQTLLNQFHDIIPGSSIGRVYDEANAGYEKVIAMGGKAALAAQAALCRKAEAVTVFNSLSWPRKVLVPLPLGSRSARSGAGKILPVQQLAGRSLAEFEVPPCGHASLTPSPDAPPSLPKECSASAAHLENSLLRVELDAKGAVTGILDKESGRPWCAGTCNEFRMYRDVSGNYEAWDLDSMYAQTPVELGGAAEIEVLAEGPLLAVVQVRRALHASTLVQQLVLRAGQRTLEFRTRIHWKERHKLLKVNFPVAVHAREALHEIQFGHLARPNHHSRPYDGDRFEVCQQKWSALAEENGGAALLNDCKYGVNVLGNSMNLTLLRAPLGPDMNCDLGEHEFLYALHLWNGPFVESGLVREAYELHLPALPVPGLAEDRSYFSLDAPNIVLETVKPAEDQSGDLILRLYESKRCRSRCVVRTALPVRKAWRTNLLEENQETLACDGGQFSLEFAPFQIVTLRLQVGRQA